MLRKPLEPSRWTPNSLAWKSCPPFIPCFLVLFLSSALFTCCSPHPLSLPHGWEDLCPGPYSSVVHVSASAALCTPPQQKFCSCSSCVIWRLYLPFQTEASFPLWNLLRILPCMSKVPQKSVSTLAVNFGLSDYLSCWELPDFHCLNPYILGTVLAARVQWLCKWAKDHWWRPQALKWPYDLVTTYSHSQVKHCRWWGILFKRVNKMIHVRCPSEIQGKESWLFGSCSDYHHYCSCPINGNDPFCTSWGKVWSGDLRYFPHTSKCFEATSAVRSEKQQIDRSYHQAKITPRTARWWRGRMPPGIKPPVPVLPLGFYELASLYPKMFPLKKRKQIWHGDEPVTGLPVKVNHFPGIAWKPMSCCVLSVSVMLRQWELPADVRSQLGRQQMSSLCQTPSRVSYTE